MNPLQSRALMKSILSLEHKKNSSESNSDDSFLFIGPNGEMSDEKTESAVKDSSPEHAPQPDEQTEEYIYPAEETKSSHVDILNITPNYLDSADLDYSLTESDEDDIGIECSDFFLDTFCCR